MDISPQCDCCGHNDAAIVRDLGIMASLDPVALDHACADAVNSLPALPGSLIEGLPEGQDKFDAVHPGVGWKAQLEHAQWLGIGTMSYELIEV